jgi:hypothetical protein
MPEGGDKVRTARKVHNHSGICESVEGCCNLGTLKMEAICPSETSGLLTGATRRHIKKTAVLDPTYEPVVYKACHPPHLIAPCAWSVNYKDSFIGFAWEVNNVFKIVRYEIFKTVTMKTVVFCDIKTVFVLHRRHSTSALQTPAG